MTHRSWYRVALAHAGGAPALVAASGEHVGEAIEAAQHRIAGSWAIAIEAATGGEIPLGESVGKGDVVMLGDAPELPQFRWPTGVLPTLVGAPALGGSRRGWTMRADPDLLVIEAQTEADQLVDLYLGLIERLPVADNLEVRVLAHFEDAGATDVWLTSRVNAKKILRLLDDHDTDLIDNGHVELGVYVRAQNATLRLTEHKTVVWLAKDRALEREIIGWLADLHVPRADALVTVRDAAHLHYRPVKSKTRKKLGDELYRQRLRKVDVVKAAQRVRDTAG